MNIQKQTFRALVFTTVITIFLSQSGCADLQGAIAQTSAWKQDAQTIQDDLQIHLNELETMRTTALDGSTHSDILDSAIDLAQTKIQAIHAAIAQADLVINEASNPSDPITIAAESISPWVPAPAQGPLVLGAALIATLVRSRNLKTSAASIVQSIDHVMKRDPEFKHRFEMNADTIRSIQTPTARKLIDTTTRKISKPVSFNQ
ncbi:MAG: hypothetical protein P1U42_08305 [Phycisphaerales bacterium]|nr:hypothetical protein [Phycisphaerales bacterium]